MSRSFTKAVWGAAIVFALCTPAAASSHKGHGGDKGGDRAVIVTIKDGAKPGVRRRLEAHGGKVLKDHSIINALTVRADEHGLAALLADPDVANVSDDLDVAPSAANSPNENSVVSNLKKTLALGNWFTGATVTAAMIDSGIANTADFTGRIVGAYDFVNGASGIAVSPADGYGHGTHIAGLAASSGATSSGTYAGVASGLKLLSLRVLDKNGCGKTSDVIAALQFAVANKARFNVKVVNLSLGHPIVESATTDPLVQAVEAAVRSGLVVVVAAGNFGINPVTGAVGYAGVTSPGNAPSAITVGAAVDGATVERNDDRVASYSSRGPSWFDGYAKPDVLAPGNGLISDAADGSTLASLYPNLVYQGVGGKLMKLSGSSMATAVVTGLVAVMMEAHDYAAQQRYQNLSNREKKLTPYLAPPALTPNAIKAMLQYSATPLRDASGAVYNALTQGAGEVDGLGAMLMAYYADTSKPAGTAWMAAFTPQTQFGTEIQTWSQNIVWGTVRVNGTSLMEVNQNAWALSTTWGAGELDNIVWGTADGEGDNIVWGTSLVLNDVAWAGNAAEGDNIVWGTALATWGPQIVWGASIGVVEGDNIVWGTAEGEADNIVWGTLTDGEGDNIVWGTVEFDNIVWGTSINKVLVLGGGVQ